MIDFGVPSGNLILTDPELVNELYIHKSKHMEKSSKMQRILSRFIGGSLLFDKSDEVWA